MNKKQNLSRAKNRRRTNSEKYQSALKQTQPNKGKNRGRSIFGSLAMLIQSVAALTAVVFFVQYLIESDVRKESNYLRRIELTLLAQDVLKKAQDGQVVPTTTEAIEFLISSRANDTLGCNLDLSGVITSGITFPNRECRFDMNNTRLWRSNFGTVKASFDAPPPDSSPYGISNVLFFSVFRGTDLELAGDIVLNGYLFDTTISSFGPRLALTKSLVVGGSITLGGHVYDDDLQRLQDVKEEYVERMHTHYVQESYLRDMTLSIDFEPDHTNRISFRNTIFDNSHIEVSDPCEKQVWSDIIVCGRAVEITLDNVCGLNGATLLGAEIPGCEWLGVEKPEGDVLIERIFSENLKDLPFEALEERFDELLSDEEWGVFDAMYVSARTSPFVMGRPRCGADKLKLEYENGELYASYGRLPILLRKPQTDPILGPRPVPDATFLLTDLDRFSITKEQRFQQCVDEERIPCDVSNIDEAVNAIDSCKHPDGSPVFAFPLTDSGSR